MTAVKTLLTAALLCAATASFAALEMVQPTQDPAPEPEAETPFAPTEPVTFSQPLTSGGEHVEGLSLEALITSGSPAFAPIEGLPAELWDGKTCTTCHQWTRADLCDHGNRYVAEADGASIAKQHPFGGGFKRNVKAWAENQCK